MPRSVRVTITPPTPATWKASRPASTSTNTSPALPISAPVLAPQQGLMGLADPLDVLVVHPERVVLAGLDLVVLGRVICPTCSIIARRRVAGPPAAARPSPAPRTRRPRRRGRRARRAAEREQQHVLVAAVGDLAAHLGADPRQLALAERLLLALDPEAERAGEDEVDLLLRRVAVDAAALAGAEQDLVQAEARDAEVAAERDEALLGVGVEPGVADAGVHACMMPTQVSDSSGVRPPWWPLKRSWCDGLRAQPRHPAGRGQHADVGETGAQARAGVREQLGGEPDLGAVAQRAPTARRRPSPARARAGSSRAPSPRAAA